MEISRAFLSSCCFVKDGAVRVAKRNKIVLDVRKCTFAVTSAVFMWEKIVDSIQLLSRSKEFGLTQLPVKQLDSLIRYFKNGSKVITDCNANRYFKQNDFFSFSYWNIYEFFRCNYAHLVIALKTTLFLNMEIYSIWFETEACIFQVLFLLHVFRCYKFDNKSASRKNNKCWFQEAKILIIGEVHDIRVKWVISPSPQHVPHMLTEPVMELMFGWYTTLEMQTRWRQNEDQSLDCLHGAVLFCTEEEIFSDVSFSPELRKRRNFFFFKEDGSFVPSTFERMTLYHCCLNASSSTLWISAFSISFNAQKILAFVFAISGESWYEKCTNVLPKGVRAPKQDR